MLSPACVNTWMIVNSTNAIIEPIAEGRQAGENIVSNDYYIWNIIVEQSKKYEN